MDQVRTHFINEKKLPVVIEPTEKLTNLNQLLSLLKENNEHFRNQLLTHGGLLFRNFPVNSVDDFIAIMEALDLGEFVDYIGGGSPRNKIKGHVYTSTEAPPPIKIHLHNELSFADNFPRHICFYCEIPPEEGGETFIGDAREIFKAADESLKQKLIQKGLKYISRYYFKSQVMDLINKIQRGHKTWIDVFETDKKGEVEQKCQQNNIGYKWNPHDWLEISRLRPAVMSHPQTQEQVWFNQIHLFDYNPRFIGWWRYIAMRLLYFREHTLVDEVRFADDTKIPRSDIYKVHDLLDQHAIYFPWQKGDVMILDNILTMHGRAPFKGKRRVLTAMTK